MIPIACRNAYFIKLGQGGEWEANCLDQGELRFGYLLKIQHFRGTICAVGAQDYLLRKINDTPSPTVEKAKAAETAYIQTIKVLIQELGWQDFELLVELVFTSSGWRRVSPVGDTQKMVDIDLVLPTTQERAFVQVKSEANKSIYQEYMAMFAKSTYHRMFFVWHTGEINVEEVSNSICLVGPDKLAAMVIDAGLASWVKDKVA